MDAFMLKLCDMQYNGKIKELYDLIIATKDENSKHSIAQFLLIKADNILLSLLHNDKHGNMDDANRKFEYAFKDFDYTKAPYSNLNWIGRNADYRNFLPIEAREIWTLLVLAQKHQTWWFKNLLLKSKITSILKETSNA